MAREEKARICRAVDPPWGIGGGSLDSQAGETCDPGGGSPEEPVL